MAHHYAPLPNPSQNHQATQHDREIEMHAAFDYSDDDDEEEPDTSETHPLRPALSSSTPPSRVPGTYDFERVDYDYPPPGSPPPLSATALPNDYGNSNGFVPPFSRATSPEPHRFWFQRAVATILPTAILRRIGLGPKLPSGPVGGGTNNDGVFANVTAKPSAPVRVQDGDGTYMVPEDARQEAPPSYASAQADAVPPYWETTVHAPFAPDSVGEMVIDSLPTGTLFSFCWNLLVSISFQFVGFLLTYLLHTSHAARLGSRAGLGVTLIQYGFALRNRLDSTDTSSDGLEWNSEPAGHNPVHHHHGVMGNKTWTTPGNMTEEQNTIVVADATTEWLSFFLMTVGWFVLLTSLLAFWRVKRWERGVLASRRDSRASGTATVPNPGMGIISQLESSFGLRGISRADLFRQGFGFGPSGRQDEDEATRRAEEGDTADSSQETDPILSLDPNDPRSRSIIQALANERRLQRDLREAGLL
ncbi:hypothetical protein CPB84DRAFT_1811466 [Gymnopilus junonius]|uniref:Metal homeostatis protein bsd2 n=1 Tax=Gymnopilus junonius TaxID=109634 RepID=A0A9P5P4P5_GYMJU|nr:hypothetical protein CPB84DRAFT_1811466 [Gymnopilus junonius]